MWKLRRLRRANAAAERKFHRVRHHTTRITGNGDSDDLVHRDDARMLVVRNTRDREYVRVLYGSIARLAKRFTRVSSEALAEAKTVLTRKDPFTSLRKSLRQQWPTLCRVAFGIKSETGNLVSSVKELPTPPWALARLYRFFSWLSSRLLVSLIQWDAPVVRFP